MVGDVVELKYGKGKAGNVLAVDLLCVGDGHVDCVVGQKSRVLGDRVNDVESSTGWGTVCYQALGVRFGGGGLVVGFLVVPGHTLQFVPID